MDAARVLARQRNHPLDVGAHHSLSKCCPAWPASGLSWSLVHAEARIATVGHFFLPKDNPVALPLLPANAPRTMVAASTAATPGAIILTAGYPRALAPVVLPLGRLLGAPAASSAASVAAT